MHWSKPLTWESIEELRVQHEVKPHLLFIDSAYNTQKVYAACKRFGWTCMRGSKLRDFAHKMKGDENVRRAYSPRVYVDPAVGTKSQGRVRPVSLFHWSNPTVKDVLCNLRDGKGASWTVLPDAGQEYELQMFSERRKERHDKAGQVVYEWHRVGKRANHLWDCEGMQVAAAIKKGNAKRVPMGILFVGPMGTGKTFVAEAFATESGLTCLKLKNFRDKWVGSTEGNLEKILNVVKALGNTLVIIDEGDRSIGGQGGGDNDGGVDSRVTARLKEFMSDTSHRGSIIFAMMTNRPDKLDADMKRPGRFDMKMPFFPPQSDEDRTAITKALLRKNGIKHRVGDYPALCATLEGLTGADIEAILLSSLNFAEDRGSDTVQDEDLLAAAADFIPSRDAAMLRYMELLAVFECSSRTMLPEGYKVMSTEELNAELRLQQGRLLRP